MSTSSSLKSSSLIDLRFGAKYAAGLFRRRLRTGLHAERAARTSPLSVLALAGSTRARRDASAPPSGSAQPCAHNASAHKPTAALHHSTRVGSTMRPSLLLLLTGASAYRTGTTKIQRREPWVVVERFCFEGRSTLDYDIKTTGATRMFIYGSKDQKSFREKVDKKAYQAMSMQKRFERADSEVVLTPHSTTSGKLKFAVDSGQTFVHVVIANFNASCNAICQDQFSCNAEFSKRCYGPVRASAFRTNLNLPGSMASMRCHVTTASFRAGRGGIRHDFSRWSLRARARRERG